jgi:hypothetical protein
MAREILAAPETLSGNSTALGTSAEAFEHQEDMAMLRELTRMSMDAARILHGMIAAAEVAAEPATEQPAVIAASQAFSRMARTARQCMALRNRLGDDHKKRGEAELKLLGEVIAESRKTVQTEKRRQVKRAVTETIEAERDAEAILRHEAENLLSDLDDRLGDELLLDDLDERPLGATVAKLCKRLGVKPDWNDWRDTAWAAEEIAAKPAGSPYAGEDWQTPVKRGPPPPPTNPFLQPGYRRWD